MADGTYVVRHPLNRPGLTVTSVVVLGAEPLVIGTGPPGADDVFDLVAPDDVRWIFLSNQHGDHAGNVLGLLAACGRASVVTTPLTAARLADRGLIVPERRLRLVDDGDVLDTGDRAFVVERPPLHVLPTTVGLLDAGTNLFWSGECWSAPFVDLPAVLDDPRDAVAFDTWRRAFVRFHHWNCPWVHALDPAWWRRAMDRLESRRLHAIVPASGPALTGEVAAMAVEAMAELPTLPPAPRPAAER